MPAVAQSLKVRRSPCWNWVASWGLNVIFSLAPWCARPEGRLRGLMKTNPSLCCPGSRFCELEGYKGHSRALGYRGRWKDGWDEKERWFFCVRIILSEAKLPKDRSLTIEEKIKEIQPLLWKLFLMTPILSVGAQSIKFLKQPTHTAGHILSLKGQN